MKRFIVELIGTFFFTLAVSLTGNPLCYGLIFAAVIYFGAHVSGGYFNPAITLALSMRSRQKSDHIARLVLGQIAGALLALFLSARATGQGLTLYVDAARIPMMCLNESLLAFLLCAVVLSVTAQKLKETGMILGFTLIGLGYIGGMFNPAISFASQFMCLLNGGSVDVNSLIVYLVCPLIGGLVAAMTYKYYQD